MNHDPAETALRNLLALRRLDLPQDTEVNRFLIEFHRRQRAQLLVPETFWSRMTAWVQNAAESVRLVPSLSYASSFAAVAVMAFLGLSQQVQVTHADGTYKLSLHLPSSDAAFAMLPSATTRELAAPSRTDDLSFSSSSAKASPTHFVLANTRVAYDATAAF